MLLFSCLSQTDRVKSVRGEILWTETRNGLLADFLIPTSEVPLCCSLCLIFYPSVGILCTGSSLVVVVSLFAVRFMYIVEVGPDFVMSWSGRLAACIITFACVSCFCSFTPHQESFSLHFFLFSLLLLLLPFYSSKVRSCTWQEQWLGWNGVCVCWVARVREWERKENKRRQKKFSTRRLTREEEEEEEEAQSAVRPPDLFSWTTTRSGEGIFSQEPQNSREVKDRGEKERAKKWGMRDEEEEGRRQNNTSKNKLASSCFQVPFSLLSFWSLLLPNITNCTEAAASQQQHEEHLSLWVAVGEREKWEKIYLQKDIPTDARAAAAAARKRRSGRHLFASWNRHKKHTQVRWRAKCSCPGVCMSMWKTEDVQARKTRLQAGKDEEEEGEMMQG